MAGGIGAKLTDKAVKAFVARSILASLRDWPRSQRSSRGLRPRCEPLNPYQLRAGVFLGAFSTSIFLSYGSTSQCDCRRLHQFIERNHLIKIKNFEFDFQSTEDST